MKDIKEKHLKFEVSGHEIKLDVYFADKDLKQTKNGKKQRKPRCFGNDDAILVIPGGGYCHVCADREGDDVAKSYAVRGVTAFVLGYRVGADVLYPSHFTDASFAVAYIKRHAEEFGINAERVFVVGFSAGGHLAGSLAILHDSAEVRETLGLSVGENKPCGAILAYPVVSALVNTHKGSFESLSGKSFDEITDEEKEKLSLERHVGNDSAPVFIWHTSTDKLVPPIGSIKLTEAYYEKGIPVSLHIYPYGPHGISLANEKTSCQNPDYIQPLAEGWVDYSIEWMKSI